MTPTGVAGAPGVAVEAATWPPLRVELVDGWRVGLSGGFTRRANSAVPPPAGLPPAGLAPAVPPSGTCAGGVDHGALARTLDRVEALYTRAGQPAVVRQDRDLAGSPLARLLDARGYATAAVTDVLVATADVLDGIAAGQRIPGGAPGTAAGPPGTAAGEPATAVGVPRAAAGRWSVAAAPHPDDAWLDTWFAVKAGDRPVDRAAARGVLVACPATYLTARDEEGVVGVLRAAVAGGWVGLSCLMVVPRARRCGLATLLTREALGRAARDGTTRAFLQVERANSGARALHEGLGLVVADSYAYRERRLPAP